MINFYNLKDNYKIIEYKWNRVYDLLDEKNVVMSSLLLRLRNMDIDENDIVFVTQYHASTLDAQEEIKTEMKTMGVLAC